MSFIKLHLEYAVQVWNLRFISDSEILEEVQRWATKFQTKLSKLSYDHRLAQPSLTSHKDRISREDLIHMYKIIKGLEVVKLKKDLNIKKRTRNNR